MWCFAADTDDDNYRPSKRTRADFRPPTTPRSGDDSDAMQSSPGGGGARWRGGGGSSGDVPMTDQTDDDPYEVWTCFWLWLFLLINQ